MLWIIGILYHMCFFFFFLFFLLEGLLQSQAQGIDLPVFCLPEHDLCLSRFFFFFQIYLSFALRWPRPWEEFAPISIAGELKDQGKANTMLPVAPGLHTVGMHTAGSVVSIAIQEECESQDYTDMSTTTNLRGLSCVCIFGVLFKLFGAPELCNSLSTCHVFERLQIWIPVIPQRFMAWSPRA